MLGTCNFVIWGLYDFIHEKRVLLNQSEFDQLQMGTIPDRNISALKKEVNPWKLPGLTPPLPLRRHPLAHFLYFALLGLLCQVESYPVYYLLLLNRLG